MAQVSTDYFYAQSAESDPGREFSQQEISLDLQVPFHISVDKETRKGYVLSGGFQFLLTRFSFAENDLDDVSLIKYKVPLSATLLTGEKLLITAQVTPGIHSEKGSADFDDYRTEGHLLTKYTQSPNLQWVLGVGYGDSFGDPSAFPIFGGIWQATDHLNLHLVFPKVEATYAVSDAFNINATAIPAGGQWYWNLDNEGVEESVDVEFIGGRVGLGMEWRVFEKWWIGLSGGMQTGQEATLSREEDPSQNKELVIENAWYAQIGIRLH
ncbi:DUF6268 family outer membrane beta-barrel protein [Kiritimatiellaeota bacterium B1221]|nr:DUF6268 family outer membrane beta-barrel protein [Kiritimatiellaeota bacterium B1221]